MTARDGIGSFLGRRFGANGVVDIAIFALALATFSRLLVAFLGAPAAVNFLHFPLVVGLFLISLRRVDRAALPLYVGSAALLLVYVSSALLNGAGAINAIIGFLLLGEPFLLFAVLVNARPDAASIRRLGWWLVTFAVVQIPIAFSQLPRAMATHNADLVQGTFTGMVAGHHILGGVAMVGSLFLLRWPGIRFGWIKWSLAAVLFLIVLISDSKQIMLAFLVAYALLRLSAVRSLAQASALTLRVAVLTAGVYLAQRLAGSHGYFHGAAWVASGFAGKFVVFPILVGHFHNSANWILGVGPGHGVTRMGGWLLEKYWHVLEPLGATRTEIAAAVWHASGPNGDRSSLFVPLFSWAGVFGDVGVAGMIAYGAVLWITFRRFCVDDTCRVTLIAVVCLGFLFEWLEEPNFMLYSLAVIGQRWLASSSRREIETSQGTALPTTAALRIAWLVPIGGLHWHPVLVDLTRRCSRLKVFTARESFARELEGDVEVEVVGRARVLGDDHAVPGYRGRLTWLSPIVLLRLYRFRPAVVFTNSFGVWTTLVLLAKPLAGWQVVVAYEGSAPGVDFLDSRPRLLLRRALVRWADACISNSNAGRRYLIDELGARPHLVSARPYLIPTNQFFDDDAAQTTTRMGTAERPLFLYLGKLIARKGVGQLLRACAHLDAMGTKSYSLLVVGEGALREDLESFATSHGLGERIHWAGGAEYAAVGAYLRAADVVVLPTWEDTWGMTVPEAFLAGKPVLCSVRAGSSELVEEGSNGFLFDPQDHEMLADRMRRFVDHPELIEQMGHRGRQVIAEHTPAAAGEFLASVARSVLHGALLRNSVATASRPAGQSPAEE